MFNRLITWAYDKNNRSPRFMIIDEGLPDRGSRYGGAQTIHNTGTVDIVLEGGKVTEVWFRCRMLPFKVHSPKGTTAYTGGDGNIVAVEFAE